MIKLITLCITAFLVSALPKLTGNIEQSHNDPVSSVSEQDYSVGEPNIE